ncbi:MAG: twin-arginine translocase TatA/TatE family subunit [Alphaproteobacteria bacterium]|nr:MAG: twin-arginine translocase TatA/TatE family subunit [Alphaproteobacteria bacterium]
MGLSFWQIAIVVLLLVLLFGRGKISDLMGDVAKGIKSFKKGMSEEDIDSAEIKQDPKVIDQKSETDVKDIKSKKTNS